MKTSTHIYRRFATVLALALAAAAVFAGSGQASRAAAGDDQSLKALMIRSEALNRLYGVGDGAISTGTATAAEPVWLRALRIRSEALNRLYGQGATQAPEPEYLRALKIRSEALNQLYGSGRATPPVRVVEGGFDWVDAGIGVAAAFGLILLAGSAVIVLRRRGRVAHIHL